MHIGNKFVRMGSHGTDEVMTPSEKEPNCSEATVELKIKTLDSQTYTLRVNKYMPVPVLKEQIATVTGVLSEQQRLICSGKVLKDDQLLSAYHVEDGHTLHLVVRQPFCSSSTSGPGSAGPGRMPNQSGADPVSSSTHSQGNSIAAHSVVLGTFNVSDQGDASMSDVNRFLSAVLTSVGLVNPGARNEESDSGVTGPERHERLMGATVMMDSTPRHQPSLAAYRAQLDSLHGGAFRFPTSISAGPVLPLVISDSLTTLSQYLQNMRQEFGINGQDHDINVPAGEAHNLEPQNPDTAARAGLVQGGLPTPAMLAEVATSTRQFLIQQVGDCLSQLARQLQEEASVTDPMVRTSIQSSAMGTGVLLQHAGALLLELGRAAMTLRMGQTTSEAVVNAGPPVFISTTGPNPIMVQSLPFVPGTGFGTIPMGIMHPGHALANGALGTGFVPRTIDIRIQTGSSGSADQGEHAAGTQVGETDQARPIGGGISMQNVSSSSGFPSVATESGGVRVVPVRTVVAAVPAAVSRPASDASSGGALGVFYPLLARIQNLDPRHLNDASRSTRVSDHHRNTETDEHPVSESSIHSQNGYSGNFCSNDTAPQHQGASASNPSEPSLAVPSTTASDVQAGASAPSDGNQQGYMSEDFNRFDQFLRSVFSGNQMHSSTRIPGLSSGRRETFPQNEESGEASGIPQTDGASGTPLDQGMFLSQVLHQAMPFIHQHLAQETSPPIVSGACHETSTSANTTVDMSASSSSENMQHQPPRTDSSQQVERKRTCEGAGNDLQHIDGPDSSPPDSKTSEETGMIE